MKSLNQAVLSSVGLVATDMDGTLTKNGQFTSELLIALESLAAKKIPVLITTGRSAGWVSAIANYLPIVGAIAENGGLFYHNRNATVEFMTEFEDVNSYRQQLQQLFQVLQSKFPQIKESADNSFRVTDWTFDLGDLTPLQLKTMTDICQENSFGFTYSTVQCHLKPLQQNKAVGLNRVLEAYFPHLTPQQVITVGDSPNDESLFNPDLFPLSVGVANINSYSDRLKYRPQYVTSLPEVAGFCELANYLREKN